MTRHSSSLDPDPSHVPEHGPKLQSASVYKDTRSPPVPWCGLGGSLPLQAEKWGQRCCRRIWSLSCFGGALQVRLTWCIFLPFTCRFLSMSQLASKSSSSSPKGLMSCSATCMWRAHSKGHHCPFPYREKSGVMSLEFQALLFLPEGGGLKVEASHGLGDIGICNFPPAYTALMQLPFSF